MKVKDLKKGDTINGLIVYNDVCPRFGVEDEIEVPLVMPLPRKEPSLDCILVDGMYYPIIHPYTFKEDDDLDLSRYLVTRNGEVLK